MGIFLTMLFLAACSSQEPAVETTPETDLPEPVQESTIPSPPIERVEPMSGQLQAVDLTAQTLTIRDMENNEQTFYFSPSTEIIGAAGAQGLSSQQGNQVIVRHTDLEGRRTAVSVEIVQR
jgi:hypothetical protein